jgi:hypothetical protein
MLARCLPWSASTGGSALTGYQGSIGASAGSPRPSTCWNSTLHNQDGISSLNLWLTMHRLAELIQSPEAR